MTKVLADGTPKTFHYLGRGKGATRLEGEPGSPEFFASYQQATTTKVAPRAGVLQSVLTAYQSSGEFAGLAPRTRRDYARIIRVVEREFRDFLLRALSDPRTRGVFMEWRDRVAIVSPRQGDYCWQVLGLILSWAKNRGLVTHNPCERGGRLYRGSRVERVWSLQDEAHFIARAPKLFHLPLLLGLWTGQREGDLLSLPWSAYDGMHIRLRQSKTGRNVAILVGGPLKIALDRTTRVSPIILTNTQGRPWRENAFQRGFRSACDKAGIRDLQFSDMRGSCVTRMALRGATVPEISAVTGHSMKDVSRILERHYLHMDQALADNAIRKLEANIRGTNLQTELQTGGKS